MEAILFLGATIVLLVGITAWTVRTIARWSGWWRASALAPAAVVGAAVSLSVVGYRSDAAGDSFWWLSSFVLLVVAAVVAYILGEVHHAKAGRHGITTAPPNVR